MAPKVLNYNFGVINCFIIVRANNDENDNDYEDDTNNDFKDNNNDWNLV